MAYFFLSSLTSSIVLPRMYYICADISLLLLSSLPARGRGKEERGLPRERGGRLIQSGHISDDEEEEEEEMDMVQSASQTGTRFVACAMSLFHIGVRRRGP